MTIDVKDLRHLAVHGYFSQETKNLISQAADEIEFLNSEIDELMSEADESNGSTKKMHGEDRQRIRTKLMHGFPPEMSDLLDLYEFAFGEKLELGKRCGHCNGEGRSAPIQQTLYGTNTFTYTGPPVKCVYCNGTGYEVKPTWMEERQ